MCIELWLSGFGAEFGALCSKSVGKYGKMSGETWSVIVTARSLIGGPSSYTIKSTGFSFSALEAIASTVLEVRMVAPTLSRLCGVGRVVLFWLCCAM